MCFQIPFTPAVCRTCSSAKPIPDEQTLCATAQELGIEFEDDYVNKCPNGVKTITVQQKADKELERGVGTPDDKSFTLMGDTVFKDNAR
ncbi:hypothetical protein B0T09DRAFT_383300 [Sordaria sp. MPI-SDFR-AT-0083]|nr:hypothetical protein B0T09DRAFT_383300 [Sordaria sp. MPI-SDFR-AT-0083]